MAEVQFPGNRMYSEPDKQKLEPAISKDSIVSTKKPVAQRFKEAFFGANGIDIIDDVVIPGLQNLLLDALEMKFFHQVNRRGPNQNYYSYQQPYNSSYYGTNSYGQNYNYNYQQPQTQPTQNRIDYRNIILRTREDAERVVVQMRNCIQEQRSVSVAQFFDLLQLPGEYTDNNWGWTNPNAIGIQRVSRGFLIVVPDAQPLVLM